MSIIISIIISIIFSHLFSFRSWWTSSPCAKAFTIPAMPWIPTHRSNWSSMALKPSVERRPNRPSAAEAPRRAGGGEDFGELGIQTGHELAGVVDHLATPGFIMGNPWEIMGNLGNHGKWWIEIYGNLWKSMEIEGCDLIKFAQKRKSNPNIILFPWILQNWRCGLLNWLKGTCSLWWSHVRSMALCLSWWYAFRHEHEMFHAAYSQIFLTKPPIVSYWTDSHYFAIQSHAHFWWVWKSTKDLGWVLMSPSDSVWWFLPPIFGKLNCSCCCLSSHVDENVGVKF